jgi:hypothetical protein
VGSPPGDLSAVVGAVVATTAPTGAVVGATAGAVSEASTRNVSRTSPLSKHHELDLPGLTNVCSPENVSKLFSSRSVTEANWYYLDKTNRARVCFSLMTTYYSYIGACEKSVADFLQQRLLLACEYSRTIGCLL